MAPTGRDAWRAATAAGLAGAARNAPAAAHAPATRHASAARCRWVAAGDAPGPAGLAAAARAACSYVAGGAARRATLWVAGRRLACPRRRPPAARRGLAGPIGPSTPAAPGALAGRACRGTPWVARRAAAGRATLFTVPGYPAAARDGVSPAASRAAAAHRPARTSGTATSTAGAAGGWAADPGRGIGAATDTARAPAARAAGGRAARWGPTSGGPTAGGHPAAAAPRGGIDRGEAEAARSTRADRPVAAARAKPRDRAEPGARVAGFARGATVTCCPPEGRTAPGRTAAGTFWVAETAAAGRYAGAKPRDRAEPGARVAGFARGATAACHTTEDHSTAGRAPGGPLWVGGGREVAARRVPTSPPRSARQTGQD